MVIEQSVFKGGEVKIEEIIIKEKEKIINFAQDFVNQNFEKDPERFKKALCIYLADESFECLDKIKQEDGDASTIKEKIEKAEKLLQIRLEKLSSLVK